MVKWPAFVSGADGIRTRVWSLKGTCPRPLDDSAVEEENSTSPDSLAKAKLRTESQIHRYIMIR